MTKRKKIMGRPKSEFPRKYMQFRGPEKMFNYVKSIQPEDLQGYNFRQLQILS